MTRSSQVQRTQLGVTSLSQFVRMHNCERFLRFRLNRADDRQLRERWGIPIQPLTPLLQDEGADFEQAVCAQIESAGVPVVDFEAGGVADTVAWLQDVTEPVALLQAALEGVMGNYLVSGRADILYVRPTRRNAIDVTILDIKASRHERMEHRLQVAAYAHLLQTMAAAAGIEIAALQGGVLHMQEDGSLPTLRDHAPFDLDTYITILGHLILDEDSVAERVAGAAFADVPFHLSQHCDGCLYNSLCLYDAAERQDLCLVPAITVSEKRTLQAEGVTNLRDLAELMEMPPDSYALVPAAGKEQVLQRLASTWPLAANLPVLVHRARRAYRRFDPTMRASTFLFEGGYGTLPADDEHPGLVKLFFDAQHDYLQDRVYLLADTGHAALLS